MSHLGNQPAGRVEQLAERRVKCLDLRKAGASYRAIGKALGITHGMAERDVEHSLAELSRQEMDLARQVRPLEQARLDSYLIAIASQVNSGHLGAIDRALKVAERRAKLLGLDAPTKIAPTSPDGESAYESVSDDDLEQRVLARLHPTGSDSGA